MSSKLLEPETIYGTEVTANMRKAKEKQTKQYDKKSKSLSPLIPGEQIRMKRPGDDQWSLAVCIKSVGPRSYLIESGGRLYRRNRRQSRNTLEDWHPARQAPMDDHEEDEEQSTPEGLYDTPPQAPRPVIVPPEELDDPLQQVPRPMIVPNPQRTDPRTASPPTTTTPPAANTPIVSKKSSRGRIIRPPQRYQDYDMSCQ